MSTDLPSGFLCLPENSQLSQSLFRKLRLRVLFQLLRCPVNRLSEPVARALPPLREMLEPLAKENPSVLHQALGSPDVVAPILAMESNSLAPDDAFRRAVPTLLTLIAMAKADQLTHPVQWDVAVEILCHPTQKKVHRLEPSAKALLAKKGDVELRDHAGAIFALPQSGTADLHAISETWPSLELATVDTNPLALQEAHPDKQGNAVDLGDREPAAWCASLARAIAVVRGALPTLAEEFETTLTRIVPVGVFAEQHLSASYREVPGLIYLSLHPNQLTMAEAIIHECQHSKLNALSWLDPVLHNAYTEWTSSPVRPDERPLMGLLLAVHAFVPVAALHQRLAASAHPLSEADGFDQRRAEVLLNNEKGLRTLEQLGQPTTLGQRLLTSLRKAHAAIWEATPDDMTRSLR